jgi:DNA polymerase-3 subunit beta
MRFRVQRELLADAVAWGTRNVPARPSVPVLAGAFLQVKDDSLTIASFDYESSSQVDADVDAAEDGTALVSGRLLAEITKALPDEPVDVVLNGASLEVRCGSGRFRLPTMPVEDYPALPALPPLAGTVDAAAFVAAVHQAASAVSRDESLPVLTAIRIEMTGTTLTLTSSDRYRAAYRELPWQAADPNLKAEILVPGRALVEAARAFGHLGGELEFTLDQDVVAGGTLGFQRGGHRTTGRLLDGVYPPIGRLFEVERPSTVTVSVPTLTAVVKRVALFAERTTPILVHLGPDGLTVEARGAQDAEASEGIEVDYQGEPVTLAFSEAYLLDGLGALNSPNATLAFSAPLKPVGLTPVEEPSFTYLLQPVRVNQ